MATIAETEYARLFKIANRSPIEERQLKIAERVMDEEFEAKLKPRGEELAKKTTETAFAMLDVQLEGANIKVEQVRAEGKASKLFAEPIAMMKMVKALDSFS